MATTPLRSFLERPPAVAGTSKRRPRDRSWLLPLGLLAGFFAVLALLFGDRWLPARGVTLANVVTLADDPGEEADVTPAPRERYDGPVQFQASGWIEPDPLPIKATALIAGVVDEVHVLEGEVVEKGTILATLIDDDAQLNLATAEAARDAARARSAAHEAEIQRVAAAIETLEKRIVAARAELDLRRDAADRLVQAGRDSFPEGRIVEGKLRVSVQEAVVEALVSERAELDARLAQVRAIANEHAAALALAETEVARRELALSRTQIASPVHGRVLRLLVSPGQQRMLGAENPDSGTIAYLYEPDRLQARIDVPLAEAAQLHVGQPVQVRTNFLPDQVFRGTVTRITGEADLQRNTLQAKVAIHQPDDRLRPDMLCRAEFLASTTAERVGLANGIARVRLYVPAASLLGASGATAEVWLVDESGERVRRQPVVLGSERREEFVRVQDGLKPGDRVVVNPPGDLEPGTRIAAK